MEMIDREADGSDSLEVGQIARHRRLKLTESGLHDAALDSWRNWLRFRVFSA